MNLPSIYRAPIDGKTGMAILKPGDYKNRKAWGAQIVARIERMPMPQRFISSSMKTSTSSKQRPSRPLSERQP
jgi:hypothetical protein